VRAPKRRVSLSVEIAMSGIDARLQRRGKKGL
jgi:hypothetical protein